MVRAIDARTWGAAAALASALVAMSPANAAAPKLTAADRAWIATCISQRAMEDRSKPALRAYCACMQEIVDDNQPFSVTELERTYPPAHLMCRRKARMQ